MRLVRLLAPSLLAIAVATSAWANHVVFVDFSQFDLVPFTSANGNSPPTNADVAAVRDQIFANMQADFSQFDLHLVRFRPNDGRFTRLRILSQPGPGGLLGCAGGPAPPLGCCLAGNCSGIGSWTQDESSAEIYAGSFALLTQLQGANDTTANIANAISHTASHELGHVLGLFHCHAANDFVSSGAVCVDGFAETNDANVNLHIMASGASSGLTACARVNQDRFFSVRSSRRVLNRQFQPRNHWKELQNVNAGSGFADLTYGRFTSPGTVRWFNRRSTGSAFGAFSTWINDAGERGMIPLMGDVTDDNRADLVLARPYSSSTVHWDLYRSTGSAFEGHRTLRSDAADTGHILRLGDINRDGDDDLIYGEPLGGQVRWFVRRASDNSFGGQESWHNDAGDQGNLFLIGDVDADNRDDLVAVARGPVGGVTVYRSTGAVFQLAGSDTLFGFEPDYVFLGDVNDDGDADLVLGYVESDTVVRFDVRHSNRCTGFGFPNPSCYPSQVVFRADAGAAGELFRIGDGNGDGRVDLFRAQAVNRDGNTGSGSLAIIRWFARLSAGTSFGTQSTWSNDAGNEGDIYP